MDDLQIKTRVLSSLINDVDKDIYDFNSPLQRKSNLWSPMQKSLLVDSAIRNYPIYPLLVNKVDGNNRLVVIDFKQRLTTLADFRNNKFALSKTLKPIRINGVEYNIAGLKYKKLDEELKSRFDNREIQQYIMVNATDEEQREVFDRINGGKPLSACQLRTTIESEEMRQAIYELTSHPLFEKVLSKTQRKKDLAKDIIRQTLMLIYTNKDVEYLSFKNKDINKFIIEYQENINTDKIETLKAALTKIDENFETLKINSTSLPMVFFAAYRVIKDKKSFGKLATIIQNFIDTYETNDEYKKYCVQGTSSLENVRGRYNYWKDLIKSL